MNKKIKIFLTILIITSILIFFIQFIYKNIKDGNNIIKSENDLIEYILNINSYEANIEVTINSNKTTNKYRLKQYYQAANYSKQIVEEPSNIKGLEIIYKDNCLELKNTNLGLNKIYENYTYLNENVLWLSSFIKACKEKGYTIEENNDELILVGKINEHKGKLYVDKKTNLPKKIEILDNNNKSKVYIEYKEIKLKYIYTLK